MMNEIRLLRTLIQILITGHISIALRGTCSSGGNNCEFVV